MKSLEQFIGDKKLSMEALGAHGTYNELSSLLVKEKENVSS